MHINSISCGQGAPSVYMIVAAGQGAFPADVVIVADTGDENDMLWSTGQRTNAAKYFEQVTKPLAEEFGMKAAFVRTKNRNGNLLPPLHLSQRISTGKVQIDMPLFGSRGGRLAQSCTSKYKIRAIRQKLRDLRAKTATSYIGLTLDEVERIKPSDVKWETKEWPLITRMKLYRREIIDILNKMSIPYLVTTECDKCPHKDWYRWERTSQQARQEAAKWEAQFNGDYFLTEYRIPLIEAIELMNSRQSIGMMDFCNDVCFT